MGEGSGTSDGFCEFRAVAPVSFGAVKGVIGQAKQPLCVQPIFHAADRDAKAAVTWIVAGIGDEGLGFKRFAHSFRQA